MRVVVSAYACSPTEGSEPAAGWEWAKGAARSHEVTLLTRRNNVAPIRAALQRPEYADLSMEVVGLDLPATIVKLKQRTGATRAYYSIWQLLARKELLKRHRLGLVDVAHHLTFAVDWLPAGVISKRVPCVWGPVGGSSRFPWRVIRWLGVRGLLSEMTRTLTSGLARATVARSTIRNATVVVAQHQDVRRGLRRPDALVEPHTAVSVIPQPATPREPKRAVFVGRLLPWKGVAIAIDCIAQSPEWTLEIVGDGPDRSRLEKRAKQSGAANRISFSGLLDREIVRDRLSKASVMLFPSVHDSAPFAVGEAIAAGLPVVCLDTCGPPELVRRASAGRVVPMDRHCVSALSRSLEGLREIPDPSTVDTSRTADLVDRWYELAVSTHGKHRLSKGA